MRLMFVLCALLCSQAIAGQEGWLKLQTSHKDFNLYYQPLSIQKLASGHVKVVSLINYSTKEGSAESLFSESLYDCHSQTSLDRLTTKHEGHWAMSDASATSETVDQWRKVLPNSVGASLLGVVCESPTSTQLQR